jgi:hypothetical protein
MLKSTEFHTTHVINVIYIGRAEQQCGILPVAASSVVGRIDRVQTGTGLRKRP